ncbi:YkgJ family cysteine cluster protein [Natronobacterium gregoryi]|nr:YkgJ family cysteine cluster protein [Natronobacterium gregoryi]
MKVNCEGCAGCCLDWQPLLAELTDEDGDVSDSSRGPLHSGENSRPPLDDDPNFVALARDEVRDFLEAGMAAALTLRFWGARDDEEGVTIDGYEVAAVAGRPVFFVGLCKPPKPVAPFDRAESSWLPACVFLDPETLQCRVHDEDLFPAECSAYPAHNLALEYETECERVEAAVGGNRLLAESVETTPEDLLLGSQAIGEKLFCHPRPRDLEGTIDRLVDGNLTAADRAECLAVAAASSPGTLAISDSHYEWGKERAVGDETESWVGPAIREWQALARSTAELTPELGGQIERARGASETPGWDTLPAVEDDRRTE